MNFLDYCCVGSVMMIIGTYLLADTLRRAFVGMFK